MDTSLFTNANFQLINVVVLLAGLASFTWLLLSIPLRVYRRASSRFAIANLFLIFAMLFSNWQKPDEAGSLWLLADIGVLFALVYYKLAICQLFHRSIHPRLVTGVVAIAGIALVASLFGASNHTFLNALICLLAAVITLFTARIKYISLHLEFSAWMARVLAIPDLLLAGILYVLVSGLLFAADNTSVAPLQPAGSNTVAWLYIAFCLLLNCSGIAATITRLVLRMKHLADRDQLTGLPNRKVAFRQLESQWQEYKITNKTFSVFILDLDAFKRINTMYGHEQGDVAITFVGDLLNRAVRVCDFAARLGGQEFLIVLPGNELRNARHVASKLCALFAKSRWRAHTPPLTVSIGCAEARQADSLEQLITLAEKALRKAKLQGRNQVVCASVAEEETYSLVSSSSY
ncbi:GGDEF domain-containing protein [Alteromonas aestuariivivens]|uniref:diguanylate cyclase n=1 Tax=Alteromonas aestuariivivens TaxID=1938339 RepID=A0A3D8M8K3_9ALTE|nr:GGDEF domain-containing protein [Alteromonas aestuariivivens]RDV25993.1 GGDEF domain-containing protein [Alteromonas aestuariivivens]